MGGGGFSFLHGGGTGGGGFSMAVERVVVDFNKK